jgi:DNA repair exonuclease SbcCD nuclease subunit
MKPKAVLIADVHYSLPTLQLADAAMRQAIVSANTLDIPLIVAGDLHSTKANLRGECVNAMLETFATCKTLTCIIRGNHDAVNEKSSENSLNFLAKEYNAEEEAPEILVVNSPRFLNDLGAMQGMSIHLIPYHHDVAQLRSYLNKVDKGSTIIMHQGLQGANLGDYVQDKSAITHDDVKDFRVISGHYHARQDIKTGRPQKGAVGLFSYIGNPYTLTFGEANDPAKGYQILMDDGTLQFVPTNLRKHVVIEIDADKPTPPLTPVNHEDLVWVKIKGSREELASINKTFVQSRLELPGCFKLDLIPTDSATQAPSQARTMTKDALLDSLIDSATPGIAQRERLKQLWRTKA